MRTDVLGCLYEINFPDGKKYIGVKTGDARTRFRGHRNEASCVSRSSTRPVLEAIRKFGVTFSDVKVLVVSDNWEYLRDLEKMVISLYNTIVPHGYNATPGGEALAKRPKKLKGVQQVDPINPVIKAFEEHTGLGSTSSAELLGIAYSTYAQVRAGSRRLQLYLERHIEVLCLLPREILEMLISERVHGRKHP